MAGDKNPEKWTREGFLAQFCDIHNDMEDRPFAFILGAGVSKSSGIPTGTELVQIWLKELRVQLDRHPDSTPMSEWATSQSLDIPNFDYLRAATFYPQIFERRFRGDVARGYAQLERIMQRAEPSFGYSVLAQILATTRHRVVITTNFDDLVADALFIYTNKRPLVCGHESLAGFVKPQMRRPVIAKIHRDLLLEPKNDLEGTGSLAQPWRLTLTELCKHYELAVIGYGGNDGSLMNHLESIETTELAGRMLWCFREIDGLPDQRILDLVFEKKGVLVPIEGFDELMLELGDRLKIELLADRIEEQGRARATAYRRQFEEIRKRIESIPALHETASETAQGASVAKAIEGLVDRQPGWWGWHLKAIGEPDFGKREKIYREGLKAAPNPELMASFASFLSKTSANPDEIEALHRQALDLAPNDGRIMAAYAIFLAFVRKDYDQAERLLGKATDGGSKYPAVLNTFASFLFIVRGRLEEASQLYQAALSLTTDVTDRNEVLCNLAALNLTRGLIEEANDFAFQAWIGLSGSNRQVTAELAFYRGVIERIQNRDDEAALGRLKTLLGVRFERGFWSFDRVLEACSNKLSDDDRTLYQALASAILDSDKAADLDKFDRWKRVQPIPLNIPWPKDQ